MDPHTPCRRSSRRLLAHASPPSRTPSRRQQFTDDEIIPLLSDLSPASTLEALAATDAVHAGKRHRQSFIQNSVAFVSTSERAWGIKAAFAGKKLGEWHQELLSWPWSGYDAICTEEEEYWGGLPARTVEEHEERIEIIRDDMETLEVEDLKNYIRSTHQSRSNTVSGSAVGYEHLDDFTAVITATIVQALPTLSRLQSLLDLWAIRLIILRQVPVFSRDIRDCQESMLSAWATVEMPDTLTTKRRTSFSCKLSKDIQAVLQDRISQLGRRLDTMLDLLEGSKDTLPEQWIDTMDRLENEYSSWVVTAEEVALHNIINIERKEDRGLYTQGEVSPSDGISSDTQQPAQIIGMDVAYEDFQRKLDDEHERASSPITAKELPRPTPGDIFENHVGKVSMRLDGQSNFGIFDSHDRFRKSGHVLQDGDELNETKSNLNPYKAARRPAPLLLDNRNSLADSIASSDIGSDFSYPGSATSDYFSNRPSPEIRSASLVEYVGSPALVTNPWSSREVTMPPDMATRRSSLQTERADTENNHPAMSYGIISPIGPRSRASTFTPEVAAHNGAEHIDSTHVGASFLKPQVRTRSASTQSIEFIPKHEIRKIMVRRSESYSSGPDGILNLEPAPQTETAVPLCVVSHRRASKSSEDVSLSAKSDSQLHQPQSSAPDQFGSNSHIPALQAQVMQEPLDPPKSHHRFEQVSDLGPGSTPVEIRRKIIAPTPERLLPVNPDDRLEARISSILTEIPAHIRLISGPEPSAPEFNFSSIRSKTPPTRSSAPRLNRAHTATALPTMTLAPAQPRSCKARSQNGEPEIKLYHLHQTGKDVPIKLFVRLVGEAGERVMVRIGGGWADLAEYLKEYACHHGRRSVSDTRFDIQGLPSSPMSQGSSSRPATPTSSKHSPAITFKRQQNTPGQFESPQTPVSDLSHRPTSRMSWTDEDSPSLGLAGPKVKKVDISPRKQAWVEEMLEQARGGGNGAAIGEIGKVGGTKRVFLKGRNRPPSNV